jgi:hypothetical protein
VRKCSTVWGGDRDEEARGGVRECGGIAGEGGELKTSHMLNVHVYGRRKRPNFESSRSRYSMSSQSDLPVRNASNGVELDRVR